jgi:hypothetical protein
VLDFPSCLVRAGAGLQDQLTQKIEHTIKCLRLNDDDEFVQQRCDIMMEFARGDISFSFLQRKYPFLAHETKRQGIEETANQIFRSLQ